MALKEMARIVNLPQWPSRQDYRAYVHRTPHFKASQTISNLTSHGD
jgi:hypothetical protein